MYEYIKGLLVEATPAYAVNECGGVGDYINISVNTYSQIVALQQVSLSSDCPGRCTLVIRLFQ